MNIEYPVAMLKVQIPNRGPVLGFFRPTALVSLPLFLAEHFQDKYQRGSAAKTVEVLHTWLTLRVRELSSSTAVQYSTYSRVYDGLIDVSLAIAHSDDDFLERCFRWGIRLKETNPTSSDSQIGLSPGLSSVLSPSSLVPTPVGPFQS